VKRITPDKAFKLYPVDCARADGALAINNDRIKDIPDSEVQSRSGVRRR